MIHPVNMIIHLVLLIVYQIYKKREVLSRNLVTKLYCYVHQLKTKQI